MAILKGLTASADNTGKQYYCMKFSAANTVTVTAAIADAMGVLQNKPDSGEPADVLFGDGEGLVLASAVIAAGAQLQSTAAGKAVTAVAGNGLPVIGVALEAAGADGDIIRYQAAYALKGEI